LALAADHIMRVDQRRSALALPEKQLFSVLPGTGGLTRVTDKREVGGPRGAARRGRCGGTAPMLFARLRRASAARKLSNGNWWTKSFPIRNGRTRSRRAPGRLPRARTVRKAPRASR